MPTGYTAGVQDGTITTFDQFAMQCARAFGALVMMRDEPFSAPVPDRFEPSTKYHKEALEAARGEERVLAEMSDEDAQRAARSDFERRWNEREDRRRKRAEQRGRYSDMLSHVVLWEPPSSDHAGLKEFMAQQLRESINFDCGAEIEKYEEPIVRKAGANWRAGRLTEVREKIAYHEKAIADEIERTEGRNRWLQQLRDSLPAVKSGEGA